MARRAFLQEVADELSREERIGVFNECRGLLLVAVSRDIVSTAENVVDHGLDDDDLAMVEESEVLMQSRATASVTPALAQVLEEKIVRRLRNEQGGGFEMGRHRNESEVGLDPVLE
jgi:hypothetical protein